MAEETSNEYSPLLAKMMRVDPDKVGSVTLSALGRQAVGADTEEYKKARAEVDSARQAMVQALTTRRGGPDPAMLALAQGFLAPTRTGSFGESLGAAAGRYGEAQLAEEKRIQDIARMRYELARSGLQDETEMAKMGLSVVSKLTPKLTAYQLQVRSEGIDPATPAGITRVKELMAMDKATPEMKAFAARSGLSLMDPNFAARFEAFEKNKPLETIAARMGLDLNKPTDLEKAQKVLQIETFKKESPEIAKALDSFGGDPLNPRDLARAQRIVTDNISLEQQSKRASISQMSAQTTRTRQEIDEHIRNQNFGAVSNKAAELGVPLANMNRYAGLNQIETAAKRTKEKEEADKFITEKVSPLLEGADSDIADLKRAQTLNGEIRTGWSYGVPGVGGILKGTSGDLAKIQEFDALASKAARANRIPGDHNVSNFDVQMMQKGTFSSDKQPSSNKVIIDYMLAQRQRDKDYNTFMSNYAAVNGVVGAEAIAQWRRYVNANPITARDAKGNTILNPNRIGFKEYFTAPRVTVDAQGREVQQ